MVVEALVVAKQSLGLRLDAKKVVRSSRPILPEWINLCKEPERRSRRQRERGGISGYHVRPVTESRADTRVAAVPVREIPHELGGAYLHPG